MRFIPFAKVRHVLGMRNVGFRDQADTCGYGLQDVAEQFDDLVRLGQMNAGCTGRLPEIGNGVEPYDSCALFDVEK